jgi:transposase
MLTHITEDDWEIVLEVFQAVRSLRGGKVRDDRHCLKALHYFPVHNITSRALPAEFGPWNTVWRQVWQLSQSGTLQAFFQALSGCSRPAGIIQIFDSTSIRAYVSSSRSFRIEARPRTDRNSSPSGSTSCAPGSSR